MRLKIKEYREELQLTQTELAKLLGSSQRNISNWENGTSEPDCETILNLSNLFDITIDELFGRTPIFPDSQTNNKLIYSISKYALRLPESQQYALLQFLKELVSK